MKIGVVQCNLVVGDLEYNAAVLLDAVRQAAGRGADFVMSPELALCGVPPTDILQEEQFIAASGVMLQNMADSLYREGLPPFLVGAAVANPAPQGKRIHNGAVLLHEGKVAVVGRKVLLPKVGIYLDERFFEHGVACGTVQYKGWRMAVTIGSDLWNDRSFWQGQRSYENDPVAEAMNADADVILHMTANPYRLGGATQYARMLAWSTLRYRVPLVCANSVGGQDGIIFEGRSVCFNPLGQVIARAAAFKPDILVVDLTNLEEGAQPGEHAAMEDLWKALTLGAGDFVRKCGFRKVLLGLSGGMDSALVAAIAVNALGPENVLGVLMPSPYTSRESIDLALALAANLGMETRTIPLENVMQSFDAALEDPFRGYARDVTEENIQARIRGTLLMALSNKFGSLLLGTGNKSEAAVGYSTLYGDTCGALEVIGDLYKTQVYSLARWVNASRGREVIPEGIITRAPSAELRPDQTDQDSLPPYEELDRILFDHIEQGMGLATLIEVGHAPETARRVLALVQGAEFKRAQMAPSLRVSSKVFGLEWKMPIARKRPFADGE